MFNGKKPGTTLLLILASTFLLPAGAGVAHAANERWKAVYGKEGQERIIYDENSVIPSGPARYRAWIAGFDANGSPRKSFEEFDCANRIVRDVEVIVEKPGKPVSHVFSPSDWRDIPRETPRGELLKKLCR